MAQPLEFGALARLNIETGVQREPTGPGGPGVLFLLDLCPAPNSHLSAAANWLHDWRPRRGSMFGNTRMERREFIAGSVLTPLIFSRAASAAVCSDQSFSRDKYDELLRHVGLIAKEGQADTTQIDFTISYISRLDADEIADSAALKLFDAALMDAALVKHIEAFLAESKDPETALQVLRSRPDAFLQHASLPTLSRCIANMLNRDAATFLLAADRLTTKESADLIPEKLLLSREKEEKAQDCAESWGIIAAVVIIAVAVVVARLTVAVGSNVTAATAAVIAAIVLGVELGNVSDIADMQNQIREAVRNGVPQRARIYARHAILLSGRCLQMRDSDEARLACFRATLLLFANAYR